MVPLKACLANAEAAVEPREPRDATLELGHVSYGAPVLFTPDVSTMSSILT